MKLGIIGLPQTGKKTIFDLLTGSNISKDNIEQKKSIPGFAKIRDSRFLELVKMYEPKKEAPAKIDIQLLSKIEQTTKENDIFREIADVDAICHIVRAFIDDSIYHINGDVNPLRDIDSINSELILHDLIFIEKRLERISKEQKKKDEKNLKSEQEILNKFHEQLDKNLPLRLLNITEEQKKIILSYPLLTMKKMLIVLNVDDSKILDQTLLTEITEKFNNIDLNIMQVSAKMESEIAALESIEEKNEFMEEMGIKEPALNILSKLAMQTLGLISFFTVGKDEVKQWLVKKESNAPKAASVIHSDIERGFIRAEVIKYNDLVELENEESVKKAGKLYTMGKDYIVVDGDIINFRFNV